MQADSTSSSTSSRLTPPTRRSPICTRRSSRSSSASSGTVLDKTENWGRRKLAYEIGHHREGTYVVETINGTRAT